MRCLLSLRLKHFSLSRAGTSCISSRIVFKNVLKNKRDLKYENVVAFASRFCFLQVECFANRDKMSIYFNVSVHKASPSNTRNTRDIQQKLFSGFKLLATLLRRVIPPLYTHLLYTLNYIFFIIRLHTSSGCICTVPESCFICVYVYFRDYYVTLSLLLFLFQSLI